MYVAWTFSYAVRLDSDFSVNPSLIEYEFCTFVSLFLSDIHDILNPVAPLIGSLIDWSSHRL